MKNKKLYNPSDNGRRKYVSSMRNRILAGVVAAVTAASPVLTSAAELGGYLTTSETDSGSTESLDINTGEEAAAETVVDNSGTVNITTEVENTESSTESVNDLVTKAEKSEKTGEETETKFLFINLAKAKGGTVILNEGELDNAGKSVEKRIKLVTQTDTDELGNETTKTLIHVYDKDDVLIDSEDASESASIYVCEVKTDEVVTVKVVADDGYVISRYDLQDRLIDGVKTDVGFDKNDNEDLTVDGTAADDSASEKTEFSYPVFMKDNMALTIELEKKQEKEDVKTDETTTAGDKEDLTVEDTVKNNEEKNPESVEKDLTVEDEKQKEDVNAEEEVEQGTETTSGEEKEDVNDSEDTSENTSDDTSDAEADGVESVNDDGVTIEERHDDIYTPETIYDDQENDSATEIPEQDISSLNYSDFVSQRLVLMTKDENAIVDKESHVIGNYGDIYLLYFTTLNETMNAYAYYKNIGFTVEPDKVINAAEDVNDSNNIEPTLDIDVTSFSINESENPISALDDTENTNSVETVDSGKVIALIDTGVEDGPNIVDRVSLIDDNLVGANTHGQEMVNAITGQASDAKILSIRALGDDGKGTISSIVAAMEYAINQNVDIINLSLYAKTNAINSILEYEIEKADMEYIKVVGAAGNDGADVKNYMPGSSDEAIIVGACNSEGRRLALSNYGDNVQFYINADSTSEAAAKFSGYLYHHNYGDIEPDNVLIFDKNNTEKKAVAPILGQKTDKTIKLYYLFHDGTRIDGDDATMNVFNTMMVFKEYEIMEDGSARSKINPNPELYDYNEDGMDEDCEVDVDINRGGHGQGEYRQIPITDYCQYDEETGYITIPSEYVGKDITVTIWQSKNSAFYQNMVPDELKPDEDKNGNMTIAGFAKDFPHGVNPIFNPMGCNITEVNTLDGVEVGVEYAIAVFGDDTWYIGHGTSDEQKDWSYVPGVEEYKAAGHSMGQIIHIYDCAAKCLVNVGTEDVDSDGINWLFAACISDVNNSFAGKPHSIAPSYIECIEMNEAKTWAKFYLRMACAGPQGQAAQTMACLFTAEVKNTGLIFSKTIGREKNYSDSTSRIKLATTFKIYTDYECTEANLVKSLYVESNYLSVKVSIDDLPPATYYMIEAGRCQGTMKNLTKYRFTLTPGVVVKKLIVLKDNKDEEASTTSSVKNVPFCFVGKMFSKQDQDGKPLENAVFLVEYSAVKDNANTQEDEFRKDGSYRRWYFKSDSRGDVKYDLAHYLPTWTNPRTNHTASSSQMFSYQHGNGTTSYRIPLGELRVTEVDAPTGYKRDTKTRYFDTVADRDANGQLTIERTHIRYTNDWEKKGVITNPINSSKIAIKKTDENGNWDDSLKNAEFTLYEKGSVTSLATVTIKDKEYHTFNYLCTVGKTYVIRETKTPAGRKTADELEITIASGNNYKALYQETIKNAKLPSRIKVKKTDKDGNWQDALSGVKFGLFEKGSDTQLASVTITSSDYYEFEYDCVQGKTYTVKETYTPECFETAADQDVTIEKDDKYKETYSVDVKNEWKSSTVEVTKRDGNDKWDDRLKGTQFTLYEGDTQKETITINNNGAHAFTTKLWPGKTYTIKETSTAAGFVSADDITWSISETKYQAKFSYTIKNAQGPKVKIIKKVTEGNDNELLKLSGYSLQNATFEIYSDAACKNKIGTTGTDEKGVTPEFTLPCKDAGDYTYYIKETVAPKGHKLNTDVKTVSVSLPKDNGVTKEVEFTDEPEMANVPNAFVQKLSSKGDPVEGVVFEVKLYDGTYGTAADCPADKLKKTWYLKSNEDGNIIFSTQSLADNYDSDSFYKGPDKDGDGKMDIIIPLGCTLTMQEKQTPSKYVLDDTIMIWKTDGTQKIEVKKFYNMPTPCRIKIRKLSDNGKPLHGVEFELKFVKQSEPYTGNAASSYTPLLKQGETTKATTDANGYIVWQNLDQGEYQVTETKTVSGNTLLKDPINITLPITMTDKEAKAMSAATDQGQFDEYTNKWYFYEATFEVTNSAKFIMPTTGANGVWRFIFFGFGTMAILVTGLVVYDTKNKRTRKRKRK